MTGVNMYVLSASIVAGSVIGCRLLVPRLQGRFFPESSHPTDRADDTAVAYLVAILVGGVAFGALSVAVMKLI